MNFLNIYKEIDHDMTVLMFGWEFPPHISGGLGTACYGLTQSLLEQDAKILFVVPRAEGDEAIDLINASQILVNNNHTEEENFTTAKHEGESKKSVFLKMNIPSSLSPYTQVGWEDEIHTLTRWNYDYSLQTKEVKVAGGRYYNFTGKYGPSLLDEVYRYSEVASEIARQHEFDIIHAHDWLTYLAGIEAKKISSKPLIIHVHATEFDRAGEKNMDMRVFEIEKKGMDEADKIIAVSQLTKDIIVSKYGIQEDKIMVVHNGILAKEENDFSFLPKIANHVITFLGRITYQKGPQYFIDAAQKVLRYFPDAHFIMAGSGDLLPSMMEYVAQLKISSRFHFTGFLKGKQISQVWSISDLYVMPSVSEPFGITPLEAIQAGVPVIVSNQSGVAEVMDHALKIDFWDTEALADTIINVLKHKTLISSMQVNGKKEIKTLTWKRAAKRIIKLYDELETIN